MNALLHQIGAFVFMALAVNAWLRGQTMEGNACMGLGLLCKIISNQEKEP